MAKVYDVPADMLIKKLTEILKSEDLNPPTWISFVKTGVHADKPPQKVDWWYTRCASILRKIYLNGPISIADMMVVKLVGMELQVIDMPVVLLLETRYMVLRNWAMLKKLRRKAELSQNKE